MSRNEKAPSEPPLDAGNDTSSLPARAALYVAGCGCCLLAVALIAMRLAPYALCVRLARIATGSANPINPASYEPLLPRFLPAGLFYGCLGIGFLLFNRRLADWLRTYLASAWSCLAHYWRTGQSVLRTESWLHRISLLLIVISGVIIRLTYLGEPPRNDESATYVDFVGRSIVHVLALYPAPNNHVLHSLLAWVSCKLFGSSPQALRLPVFIAGIVVIVLVYVTARRLADRNAGLYAAALVAVSGPFILYSVDARGYMLQAGFLGVMLITGMDLAAESSTGSWLLFTIAAAAGFWTSPAMLYPYLAAVGFVAWTGGRRMFRPLILHAFVLAILVVFLYMPILIVSGPAAVIANPWVRPLPRAEFLAEAQKFPLEFSHFLHGADPMLLPLFIAAGVLACLLLPPTARRASARLFIVSLLVILLTPAIQRTVPFARVLVPILPVYYIAAATGWSILASQSRYRAIVASAAALVLISSAAWHLPRSGYVESFRYFPDSRSVARFLAGELHPGDRLIISLSAGMPLAYELRRLGVNPPVYSSDENAPRRVLVAIRSIQGQLPPKGNGLLDPSLLTLPGTLREAKLPLAEFTSPRLIFVSGLGWIFELVRLPAPHSSRFKDDGDVLHVIARACFGLDAELAKLM